LVEVKEIEKKERKSKLLLKGTDATMVNCIRRAIMKNVPVLAVETVSIYHNDSILFDEFLTHRLGLLPIKTDLKTYKLGDKTKLVLQKEGPAVVYSGDIKCTDPKIELADKKIPLVKLKKGQKIKMEMEAVMGMGGEHVKWQPAIIGYQQLPIITSTKNCNQCEQCIDVCPTKVLDIKAKKVVLKDALGCILCGKCRDVCKKSALNLDYDKSSFIFNIESHGGLSNASIMTEAVKALSNKVTEFQKLVKELK
jgi:DNA-directed RNA polymerase subunit D